MQNDECRMQNENNNAFQSPFRRYIAISSFCTPHSSFCIYSGPRRSGRSIAAVLGFLILFSILLILVCKFYLFPALETAKHLDHKHARVLAARSLLLMSVLLIILLVGLLVSFRVSRFFFPRPGETRTRTKVVDAWAEAGKRMEKKSDDPES